MKFLKKQPFMTLNLINFDSRRAYQLHRSQTTSSLPTPKSAGFQGRLLCTPFMHSDKILAWMRQQIVLQYKITFFIAYQ